MKSKMSEIDKRHERELVEQKEEMQCKRMISELRGRVEQFAEGYPMPGHNDH